MMRLGRTPKSHALIPKICAVRSRASCLPTLTRSDTERREMMAARYAQSPNWLRDLFGWNAGEKRRFLGNAGNYCGLQPLTDGATLPLHHFDIVWRGPKRGKRTALLSSSLDIRQIRQWVRVLCKGVNAKNFLSKWQVDYPELYVRAASALRPPSGKPPGCH